MTEDYLAERARYGKRSKFQKAMAKVADVDPASWGDLQAWVQRTGNEMVDMKREEGRE